MNLVLVEAPAAEPVSTSDFATQVRVTLDSSEMALVAAMLTAARQLAESTCAIQLINATYELRLDQFPCDRFIELTRVPLQDVLSVKYTDPNGIEQTLSTSTYTVDKRWTPDQMPASIPTPGRILLNVDQFWPATQFRPNAVRIQFKAGFGIAGTSVPPAIRQWILLKAASMFEHREADVLGSGPATTLGFVDMLLAPWKQVNAFMGITPEGC